MAITPYRPSTDLFPFFDDLLRGGGRGKGMSDLLRAPETDVVETENEIRVIAEVPGMRPEDVEIDLENNVLTITGEKKEVRTEGEEGRWHLSERRYGRFSRSFVLPREVDQDRIQARCDNGVLEITIPKGERARRRRIEIGGGGEPGRGEGGSSENR